MSEGLALATAFADHKPEAAARALEEIPPEAAALFLAALPPKLVAPLLEHMSPWTAARRLSVMSAETAAAILLQLDGRTSTAILRVCAADARSRLLAQLPARRVQHFRRSLAYTLDTVGAWIDYDVPALPGAHSVGEALSLLRQRNRSDDAQVFVLRSGRIYAGVVSTAKLLNAALDVPISRLADRDIRALSDVADVDAVDDLRDWDHTTVLPVTSPDGGLLGGLSRGGLRRALDSVFPRLPPAQPESLLAHLFGAYLRTGAEMMRLLIARDTDDTVAGEDDES